VHSELFKYTRDDLLIAIPGQTERLSLVEASRPWRRGVNTFVALEKPLKENDAPKGFLVGHTTNACKLASLTAVPAHIMYLVRAILLTEGMLLQSKTAENKEHFGTFQDPRSKNEWEKAGDLR